MPKMTPSRDASPSVSAPEFMTDSPAGAPVSDVALPGAEWVKVTPFRDVTEEQVLREVYRRVSEVKSRATLAKHSHPLVLLDLDSTLYEVGPRSWQILKEWSVSEESQEFGAVRARMETLLPKQVGYSIKDTFRNIDLDLSNGEVKRAQESAKHFWASRFFTSAYLKYDHAYEGAAHFALELHRLGAELVYLTGRDSPNMGDGTRDNLIRDGFPWGVERTHLLLKPDPAMPDLDHKKDAAHYIREHGTLVASFENEPKNLVALYEIFPEAMHVFVDTVYSDHEAVPWTGLYRIRGFSHGAKNT
jgi:hypothetical protein